MTAEETIKALQLIKLPREGGWFRELRKLETPGMPPLPDDVGLQGGSESSSILFMLTQKEFSSWHKLTSDEYTCFHAGKPIRIHMLFPDGSYKSGLVGNPLTDNHVVGVNGEVSTPVLQYLVPKGVWFSMELVATEPGSFGLVSCIAIPRFTWQGYEDGDSQTLSDQYPDHQELIKRMSRN